MPGYSSSRALKIALVLLLLVRLRNSVIEHIVEAQRTRERDGKQLYHIIKPTGPTSYSTGTHALKNADSSYKGAVNPINGTSVLRVILQEKQKTNLG